jgi:tetratricopeptide (TPR) repeat protein
MLGPIPPAMSRPPARAALAAALALALLGPACKHTWEKKVEATPEEKFDLYSTTATYLYEDDDLDGAQEQAVKALEIEPDNFAMRRMIGWIRLRKAGNEDLILAESFFRDLLDDEDTNENTRLGLAIACERLGKAYDDVARALAAGQREPEPGQDAAESARQLSARARDYWNEAIAILDDVLVAGEGNTNAMNALQRVHALAGNYETSLDWSQRLLARTDEELATWRRLLRERDLTPSEEDVYRTQERAAVDLQTNTHLFAATLLFRLQRFDEALGHLDALVASSPALPQAYSIRGQVRARVGLYQAAIEDLDRYLALSDAPYEHPDVQRAFELRADAERQVQKAAAR